MSFTSEFPRSLPLRALLLSGLATLLSVTTVTAQETGGPRHLESADLNGIELRTVGPAIMSGRIVDVAVVESDPYVFYAASATGGVWKTTNNGITFEPVFEKESTHSVGAIAVQQEQPDIVWVGTGERANRQSSGWGDGIYKSVDGGTTWTHMGLAESHHIGRVALHPTDSEVVFVAAMGHLWGANEERGVYRSRTGGADWERVLYVDEDTGAVDVAVDLSDPSIVYAATYQRRRTAFGFHGGGPGSGLYRSADGGDTWVELSAGAADPAMPDNPDHPHGTLANGLPAGDYGRLSLSIYRSNPRIVYLSVEQGDRYTASTSYEGERYAGVYRSEDGGDTWAHMSDWNPRPMYASQILVDPSDDQRIYMQNSFSFSDDGGRTWTVPRQSVHSDDRHLWVNPSESRHLIKASDGALAISYDRGITWLWASNLPVSQFYRVSVDQRDPYWIYGGLQDNGTWMGPSATTRSEGILNEDWRPIGGGDGFLALVDPEDPDIAYVESQYLGLARIDLASGQTQSIRPGNPEGYKFGRRNWRLYGTEQEPRLLEQEMEPGNWDGPYILSPHDSSVVYAGTENFYVSRDRGASWRNLGRLSDAWERSEVTIMGQDPTASVASLDDGVPYFATITTIAESPLRRGMLFAGTDDGNVQRSLDGGETWANLAERFPGLPARTWVADIEMSSHDESVVFAAFDGHRSDDFSNYLYRSNDAGETWVDITSDMPAERVIRAMQQDAVNPDLLYVATELGFFVSVDAGARWVELRSNLPTLPINDFVIHSRDHDLVLGSHARGVWILDSINALRGLDAEALASEAKLFPIRPARMIRRARSTARVGDTQYRGQNPPAGAIIDYWLRDEASAAAVPDSPEDDAGPAIVLEVLDAEGVVVRTLQPETERGINRVVWDLRHDAWPSSAMAAADPDPVRADMGGRSRGGFGPRGPLVVPGTYTVRLIMGDMIHSTTVDVSEDPRVTATATVRRAWTHELLQLGRMYADVNDMVAAVLEYEQSLEERSADSTAAVLLRDELSELRTRIGTVMRSIEGWVGEPTADQRSTIDFCVQARDALAGRWENMR
jgi:photosystem II stability/assembly factor-like uncharacterized protein